MMRKTRFGCDTSWLRQAAFFLPTVAVAALAVGCGRQESGESASETPFHEITSPAGPGSGEPHLAQTSDGRVGMSWIEARPGGGHRLLWSALSGDRWSPPATIAEGDSFFVNWADFPSFVASGELLYAHWLWKNGRGTYAYEVRVAVSEDGGATWSPPVVAHDDATATEHGFVSMVPAWQSSVRLVWLDGRVAEGLEEDDPRRRLQLRSALVTPELEVRQAALLDDRVCDCCATAMVVTSDGVLAAYRDRSPDEIRDISLVGWSGGKWSDPRPAWKDGWQIAGCPVNGPALDANGASVALVWYTAAADVPAVLCAVSPDGGRTFPEPVRADDGDPLGRLDVLALEDGSAIVSWLEKSNEAAEIAVRRVQEGETGPRVKVSATSAARSSGFPRLLQVEDEVLVAWTDVADSSRVRLARAPVAKIPRPAPQQ